MKFKQIPGTEATVPKVGGIGTLKRHLWVSDSGGLFVQFTNNTENGTYSPLLFSVSEYASQCRAESAIENPIGYCADSGNKKVSKNSNDGAFLKAALCQLLPLLGCV